MWGVDFLFGYYNMKVGICFIYVAEHLLQSNCNDNEAEILYKNYLKKYTEFKF